MKTTLVIVLLFILYAGCSVPAEALCAGTSVVAFGAKGDGKTDDTAAIQSAISAAASAGGGSVVFNSARYFTTGTFTVPTGVVLCGAIEGPFDISFWPVAGANNPATLVLGPTLLITNTSAPFITLQGVGAGVTDLLFHYPNQADVTASAPIVYPYTIVAAAPGTKVVRCFVTNAYDFLDIESGRVLAQDLKIGAYHYGVKVDHAYDHVTLRNILNQIFWTFWNTQVTPTINTWVMNNGIALVVNRADSLEVHDLNLFSRFAGMLLTDSPDTSQNPRCGFGTGSDINFDTVQYGIIVTASNSSGYEFTNVIIGSGGGGQAAVQLRAGGSIAPDVLVDGGSIRGNWTLGAFPAPAAGNLKAVNIIGYDLP